MEQTALQGGFADAPRDAARAFRACLNAMARPGAIETIAGATPPAPLSHAAGTVLLTLCDAETPVFLAGDHDRPDLHQWLAFHTGAPVVTDRARAQFAVGAWKSLLPLETFAIGTPDYPDRSATLIVEMPELSQRGATLTGPGIKERAALSLPDNHAFAANNARFPLGLDFFFCAADQLAALPRTTRVETA